MPKGGKRVIIVVAYIPNTAPRAAVNVFTSTLLEVFHQINAENKEWVILEDMDIPMLK